MRTFFLLYIIFLSTQSTKAQTDQDLIKETLNDFIQGTTYNYPDRILSAFYPETSMFLYNEPDTVWIVKSEEYASWYSRRAPGTKNNRINSIKSIVIENNVAFAKLEVLVPSFGNRYYDLMLLKKIEGEWKIVSKVTSAEPIPKSPQQIMIKPVKEVIMEGFNRPWSMAFLSEEEVLIAEKDGDLLRVDLTTKERKKISGLPDDIARAIKIDTTKHKWGVFPSGSHGQTRAYNAGLFKVLLDPDFEENSFIYLSYAVENSKKESTTKVIRGKLNEDKLTNVEKLFLAEPYSHGLFHYGGGMAFGPDGKLYISLGERNFYEENNPSPPLSQDVSDTRGKIIRINSDGSIPTDNPDFGYGAVKGLYATGLRASQGLAVDPSTEKIWFSEHGSSQGDELNILEGGANYGWPNRTTGGYRSNDYNPVEIKGTVYTDPVHYWDRTVAPTGIAFYQGREFAQWKDNLLVSGLSKGSLWRIIIENDEVIGSEELFINDRVRLRGVAVSPRGRIYLLTDEENGRLIRVKNLNNGIH